MPALTLDLPSQKSLVAQNLSRWAALVADPKLARLTERIETDRFGRIIMSPPPSAHHGSYQFRIGVLLRENMDDGRVITECPICTADGVKAADVAWASAARLEELGDKVCFPRAPEICVEVLSPSNTREEILEKTALYFDAGALEVWICSADGTILFHRVVGKGGTLHSEICPSFPAKVTL